jgi:hypothetical protein
MRAVKALWGCLREIPVTGVAIYGEVIQRKITCNDKCRKRIARVVQGWLENKPPAGARLNFEEFTFDVVYYNHNWAFSAWSFSRLGMSLGRKRRGYLAV